MSVRGRISAAALAANGLFLAMAVVLWSTNAWRYYLIGAEIGSASGELILQNHELMVTVETGPLRPQGRFAQVIDPDNRPFLNVPFMPAYRPQELANKWWRVQWESKVRPGSLFAPPTYTRSVRFPFWLAVAPLLVWPLVALVRMNRRRRRVAARRCLVCGYDLRATPDRCPECGAVVEPPRRDENPLPLRERLSTRGNPVESNEVVPPPRAE